MRTILLAIICSLIFASIYFFVGKDWFLHTEKQSLYSRYQKEKKTKSKFHKDIYLVEINNQSTEFKSRTPWSPKQVAKLLKVLREAKVSWIIFDHPLLRRKSRGLAKKVRHLQKKMQKLFPPEVVNLKKKPNRRRRRRKKPSQQEIQQKKHIETLRKDVVELIKEQPYQELLQEIKKTKNLIIGYPYYRKQSDVPGSEVAFIKARRQKEIVYDDEPKKKPYKRPLPYLMKKEGLPGGRVKNEPAPVIFDYRDNPDIFPHVTFHGFSNLQDNNEKVLHRIPLFVRYESHILPSLALASYTAIQGGKQPVRYVTKQKFQKLLLEKGTLPLKQDGSFQVFYPNKRFPYSRRINAGDLVAIKDFDKRPLKGKIVFVGYGNNPTVKTPFKRPMPSLEVHASVLSNLLHATSLKRSSTMVFVEIGALIALTLLLALLFQGHPLLSWLGWIGIAGMTWFINQKVFFPQGDWYQFSFVLMALFITLVLIQIVHNQTTNTAAKQLAFSFFHKVHADDYKRLLKSSKKLRQPGKSKEVSVVGGNLDRFGSCFTENTSPTRVVEIYSKWVPTLFATLRKMRAYIQQADGNAFQANYNVISDEKDHVLKACDAALQIKYEWLAFLPHLQQEGCSLPHLSLSVASGEASVGNMGGNDFFSFQAIGTPVDTSTTLQSLSKRYQASIVISQEVAEILSTSGLYVCRELDWVRYEPKQQGAPIYELLGKTSDGQGLAQLAQAYKHGLDAYRNKNFSQAKQQFQQILEHFPQDGPSHVMLARCKDYQMKPPSFQWDGSTLWEQL